MQSAIGNGTLAAATYEKNPNQMYPQVHIVGKPMPISSNLPEPVGNDRNVVYPLGNVPPKFHASTHGKAPSTSNTFLINSFYGNAPNISKNGNAPSDNGNALLHPPLFAFFCNAPRKKLKKT